MVAFLGFVIGFLILLLPTLFWSRNTMRMTSQEFIKHYPRKKQVYYFHIVLPITWTLIYAIVIVPIFWVIGDNNLYLVSFAFGGGLAFGHGIIEIFTSVSMRNFSRGGPATYLVDDSIKRLGWIRLGLVFFLGLIPLIIIFFL